MKNRPLISLLSPCYNVDKYLPQCLDSIISQTYRNLQIVLIDDGSKDDTWDILQKYANIDSRIKIYHQDNQGVAITRNNLIAKIKGDYFLFVDSDDWIESNMIEYLTNIAIQEEADMVTCGMMINNTSKCMEHMCHILNKEEAVTRFLYHLEFRGSLCNKLCKTSLLHNAPSFLQGVSFGEDALFCWELLKEVEKVVYTNCQLYHYRMVETSLTHSSFGLKKLSGHQVWSRICEETELFYPQLLNIASARHCIEDTLLLRDAAHCGYQEMENIKMLQRTIKKNWHCLNKVKITSLKMKIYAFFASRSYWMAGKI